MKIALFVPFFLGGLALSGPARRDCGQEKCHEAVNSCGMTYGGCWTECSDGFTELPTFTVPACSSSIEIPVNSEIDVPTQTSNFEQEPPSKTDDSTSDALITTPPSLYSTVDPATSATSACSPLWLCIDYLAVCGDMTRMYGGCYDICTSSPPVTSPPCSLSSTATTSGYATSIPTPEPGVAYTEKPASDNIEPAIDNDRALVMAEMPNADTSTPTAPDAGELRTANTQSGESDTSAASAGPNLIEAPASLRGQAIAKVMADKVRKPNTANVECYDNPFCKEVQLGPSQSSAAEPLAEPSQDSSTETSAEPSDEPSVN